MSAGCVVELLGRAWLDSASVWQCLKPYTGRTAESKAEDTSKTFARLDVMSDEACSFVEFLAQTPKAHEAPPAARGPVGMSEDILGQLTRDSACLQDESTERRVDRACPGSTAGMGHICHELQEQVGRQWLDQLLGKTAPLRGPGATAQLETLVPKARILHAAGELPL